MKKFFMATMMVVLFSGLLLSSCNNNGNDPVTSSKSIVGKWVLVKDVVGGETNNYELDWEMATFIFNENGTFSYNSIDGTDTSGTWKYENNKLTLTVLLSATYIVKELSTTKLVLFDNVNNEEQTFTKVQ